MQYTFISPLMRLNQSNKHHIVLVVLTYTHYNYTLRSSYRFLGYWYTILWCLFILRYQCIRVLSVIIYCCIDKIPILSFLCSAMEWYDIISSTHRICVRQRFIIDAFCYNYVICNASIDVNNQSQCIYVWCVCV